MSNSTKPGYPAPPPPGRVYGMMGAQEMSALGAMHKFVTAQTLLEYRWPLEGKDSEHYFLQEQVSEYLGVKSFKRRYPDVQRRQVDHEERDFLVEMKVVNVTQADLGLTAIPSVQVKFSVNSYPITLYQQYSPLDACPDVSYKVFLISRF